MFTFGLRWGEGFVAPAAAFEEGGTETVGQALRPSVRQRTWAVLQLSAGNGHSENELIRPRAKKRMACPPPLNFFFFKWKAELCANFFYSLLPLHPILGMSQQWLKLINECWESHNTPAQFHRVSVTPQVPLEFGKIYANRWMRQRSNQTTEAPSESFSWLALGFHVPGRGHTIKRGSISLPVFKRAC